MQILTYVFILLLGAIFTKKNLIPFFIKERLDLLQSISLFILLGAMGYKIGVNEDILNNLGSIGKNSLIFGFTTSLFSIFTTFLFFKLVNKFIIKKEDKKC